jgi:AcrR family transcriptional regulator
MGRRSDHSRDELEALFIAAGEAHLAEAGLARFSAREVAKRVGYSVGTLYHLFGSYDRFVLAINARTLLLWSAWLEDRLAAGGPDRIASLVQGYFDFAQTHTRRWAALYEHHVQGEEPLPDWFGEAFAGLMDVIEREVARALHGEAAADGAPEVQSLTGSLVATVHGHCSFALHGTSSLFGAWQPAEAALQRVREALTSVRATHSMAAAARIC